MKSPFTRALLSVVVLGFCVGAAFAAGMAYQRATGPKATVATATTTTQGAAPRTPQTSGGVSPTAAGVSTGGTPAVGVAARGGGYTAGTIQTVSGQALTVTTAAGTQMNVTLSETTRIGAATTGDVSALKAGTPVLISGPRDASGTLQAASVVTLPSGFLPGE